MIFLLTAAIVVCIFLSAFFSASEMSYNACNTVRLENLKDDGDRRAKAAFFITEHYDDALGAILIGNNLVNIAASSLGSVLILMIPALAGYDWVSTAAITLLVIIFGETIPKITAKKNSNRLALRFAPAIRALMFLLTPLIRLTVFLIRVLTRSGKDTSEEAEEDAVEELQSIIETAEVEEVLDENRSELVQAAIDFSGISASEVMTARVDIVAADLHDSREQILELVNNSPYSRIPIYDDSIDKIIGILTLNHFLRSLTEPGWTDLRALLLEPCFVYKTTPLPKVLSIMRRNRQHMAIVTDEYGGTLGLITMEDVLEQIVGDIWDENDTVEPEISQRTDGSCELDGDISLTEFAELFDLGEIEADSETAGGLVLELFDRFPQVGEHISYQNLDITVLEMDGRRVSRLLVQKTDEEKRE